MSTPEVSIVIPCRNEARHIEACLESVLAFETPPGGFEVIVADGMSDDGTREILARIAERDPRVRMVDNPERTTPHALNAGIRMARGRIVARIDAHTEYAPDYLRRCVELLESTDADNVGGPARTRAEGYGQRAVCSAYHSPFAVGGSLFHNVEYEGYSDSVPYGCYRRARLLEIGLFDEELVRNQDDELNFRLQRAGGKIWQSPRVKSWYRPRSSLSALFRQYWQYGYWKVRVIQKHGQVPSPRHLAPGTFALTLFVLAVASLFLPEARWLLAGLSALYGIPVLIASVLAAAKDGWDLLPMLPFVFACYHFGYGLGFLAGVWDFMVLKRSGRYVSLTRK